MFSNTLIQLVPPSPVNSGEPWRLRFYPRPLEGCKGVCFVMKIFYSNVWCFIQHPGISNSVINFCPGKEAALVIIVSAAADPLYHIPLGSFACVIDCVVDCVISAQRTPVSAAAERSSAGSRFFIVLPQPDFFLLPNVLPGKESIPNQHSSIIINTIITARF